MAKILMVNIPYSGHTNPTLPLTRELVQRGHKVGYINAPEWRDQIQAAGADFIPYLNYPEGLSDQQKKTRCFLAAYQTAMSVGGEYDMLVYEMLFYPGKTIAQRLGIPAVRQFSQPAWNAASFEALRKSSLFFQLSCKIIDWQMMNRKTARQMGMEDQSLIDSVIHEVPELNIVYSTQIT